MAWERKFLSLICKNIFFQLQLLLLMGCSLSDIAISDSNLVKFLPGFQGPLPFQLETGYVGVGEAEEVQIFYYFVESQRDPETDPLVLWLTGGPGCSGFSSLVFELGPMKYDKYNMDNESLPTLLINTNSLTKVSNMIFVDSPIGTGFSYATNSLAYQTGDTKQVNFLYHFLHKWLIDHPKFISNPVYIGGDSYSGITVPMLSLHIAKGNEEGLPYINLQGYLLGNPVTNPSRTINFQIPYVHGMGLISDELYKAFEKNCGGEYAIVDPSNIDCLKNFEVYEECTSRIGSEHILEPLCTSASLKSQHIKIRSLTDQVLHGSCIWDYQNTLSGNWVNSPSVRKALHVREIVDFHGEMVLLENYSALNYTGLVKILKKYDKRTGDLIRLPFIQKVNIGKWQRCHFDLQYDKDVSNSIPYHVILSAKGYRSLIYSGDHDMVVPFLETQAWIRSLNYSIVDDWRPWLVQDQFAGYTRTYSNQMTFATIKGAGHIAPNWKPKECYSMFQRWLEHQPL